MAVTCPSFTFCSGLCYSKESGPVSIMSTPRLFDVSQGVNEKKNIANYLVLYVQLKQIGGHRRHIIQVLLQSSEVAQATEIASTGKASGSNVQINLK